MVASCIAVWRVDCLSVIAFTSFVHTKQPTYAHALPLVDSLTHPHSTLTSPSPSPLYVCRVLHVKI